MFRKRNSQGFTLTELLAASAILVIIILLGILSFNNIRSNVLKRQHDNVINYLQAGALKYAETTGITTVNVETLIKEGYIDSDDDTDIYDPISKESMNCYLITSTFDKGVYVDSKIDMESKENDACKEHTIVTDLIEICRVNDVTGECEELSSDVWLSDDITLGVRYVDNVTNHISENASYEWLSSNGHSSYKSTIDVNVNDGVIETGRYQVKMTDGDVIGRAYIYVKIDKQNPVISTLNINKQETWTEAKKAVSYVATDFTGSGIVKQYLGMDPECKNDPISTNNETVSLGNGTYYICLEDAAGRKSITESFTINRVDTMPNNPTIYGDGVASGMPHDKEFDLEFSSGYPSGIVEEKDASKIHFEYRTSVNSNKVVLESGVKKVHIGMSTGRVTYYVKACNEAGMCTPEESYEVVTILKVKFDTAGGNANKTTMDVIYNKAYDTLPTVTKKGHTFNGWFTSASGGTKITSSTIVTAQKDHTLYAHWTVNTYTASVTKAGSGTVGSASLSVAYDAASTVKVTPSTGYYLSATSCTNGYTTNATVGQANSASRSSQTVTISNNGNDTNSSCAFTFAAITSTATFDGNGGSPSTTNKTVTYDTYYSLPSNPTRSGYLFKGWYTASSGGSQVTSSTKVTATDNHRIYAQWYNATLPVRVNEDPQCVNSSSTECWYKNNATSNYLKYINNAGATVMFRIYHRYGNNVYIIYDGNDWSGYYGQNGLCAWGCCNQGNAVYYNLMNGMSQTQGKNLSVCYQNEGACFNNTVMSTNLNSFYNSKIRSNSVFASFTTSVTSGTNINALNTSLSRTISLLTYSEYKNIANCSGTSCNSNYLSNTNFWLADGYSGTTNYYVASGGNIYYSSGSLTIKPTLSLSNAKITGGTGTSSNPYVVYYDNRAS